jgi:type IV pilus assembly protein PilM
MLGFVQNWFAPRVNPIGVDFGGDCLRMAQVQWNDSEPQLIAAASCDVPGHVRQEPGAHLTWFSQTVRELLAQGKFRGRQAMLCVPAAWMHIQHLRVAKMENDALKKALPWELKGKLPIDPSAALLRHLIAGEVHNNQESLSEVIVMAAARKLVEQFLAAAEKGKLDVVGMNVQPSTIVDCFRQVYRRKTDAEATTCFVDIGYSGTRAVIARGGEILFARVIPIGAEQFNQAVADELKIGPDEARLLRLQSAREVAPTRSPTEATPGDPTTAGEDAACERQETFALLEAGLKKSVDQSPVSPMGQAGRIKQAETQPANRLADELDLCRRYYEATFVNRPVDRLIFVGGEANQRDLCRQIARRLSLAAQVGDPLTRMGRTTDVGIESGIDRREPQPAWAVAIGLSLNRLPVTSC